MSVGNTVGTSLWTGLVLCSSLTGLNEWNVCAVTFTLCKTMAVRFIYPSIHLLLFIRFRSRLQQDKQDRLLQMFSTHPASFYVKSLQPYSEAPPDIWALEKSRHPTDEASFCHLYPQFPSSGPLLAKLLCFGHQLSPNSAIVSSTQKSETWFSNRSSSHWHPGLQ